MGDWRYSSPINWFGYLRRFELGQDLFGDLGNLSLRGASQQQTATISLRVNPSRNSVHRTSAMDIAELTTAVSVEVFDICMFITQTIADAAHHGDDFTKL